MTDYSQYPQRKLLEFIVNGCKQLNEERDFASYLISMDQADSIEEIISIFNNIYKLMVIIYFENKNPPSYWYKYELWNKEIICLVEDLFDYLNKSILSYLKRQDQPTEKQCISSIVNLRGGKNISEIQNAILAIEGDKTPKKIFDLIEKRNSHFSLRKKIDYLNLYNRCRKSHYYDLMDDYKLLSNILADNGYVFDVIEDTFAQQHNLLDYKTLYAKYKEKQKQLRLKKEEKEKQLRLKTEEEEKRKKKEERRKNIQGIFVSLAALFALVVFTIIITKIGIFGIIILLGLPGALLSYLKK